ncbi:MAG: choice-of-anchor M domain-containing protein [Bifidobacteriaceae bacterium]|nr:choice-of-anchor M domain-containing protein [Bifidobacteriaceae bacterium]
MKKTLLVAGLAGALALTFLAWPGLGLGSGPGLAPAFAEGEEDPNLDQTLSAGAAVVHGERVLTAGHVDMGPRFVDGKWKFLIHDDVAKADANATSVWRYPAETVFHLFDESQLPAPEDPAYSFLGAEPGQGVWVSPQTQNPDVVWVGWNTQDPEVMEQLDRGVTLTLLGVQGPGVMTVFLQSGSFGEPQLLWDSRVAEPQPLWVDVNTHTHANWAFTEPGVYLVELEASADLIDGTSVADTQLVRFAVGSDTAPADALAAEWGGAAAASAQAGAAGAEQTGPAATATAAAAPAAGGDPLVPILIGAIALVAVVLVAVFGAAIIRGRRAKQRVLAARAAAGADGVGGGPDGAAPGAGVRP